VGLIRGNIFVYISYTETDDTYKQKEPEAALAPFLSRRRPRGGGGRSRRRKRRTRNRPTLWTGRGCVVVCVGMVCGVCFSLLCIICVVYMCSHLKGLALNPSQNSDLTRHIYYYNNQRISV